MKRTKPTIVELSTDVLKGLLRHAKAKHLNDGDCEKLKVLGRVVRAPARSAQRQERLVLLLVLPLGLATLHVESIIDVPSGHGPQDRWFFACAGGAYARTATSTGKMEYTTGILTDACRPCPR